MPFDLSTIATAVGTVKSAVDVMKSVAPVAARLMREATDATLSSIRVTQCSNGYNHLYPRYLPGCAWEVVAVADVSLLNLADKPADIESIRPILPGSEKVALWKQGLVLNPLPATLSVDLTGRPHGGRLIVGGEKIQVEVTKIFTQMEGFPLVIPAGSERRIRLAFLIAKKVEQSETVSLRLSCRQRGQRFDRPISGVLEFGFADPSWGPARFEYDPKTGYLTWVHLNEGAIGGAII